MLYHVSYRYKETVGVYRSRSQERKRKRCTFKKVFKTAEVLYMEGTSGPSSPIYGGYLGLLMSYIWRVPRTPRVLYMKGTLDSSCPIYRG